MVAVYLNGNRVGSLADLESLLPNLNVNNGTVELRDSGSGRKLATVTPEPICPWEPDVTEAELVRRAAAPGGMPLKDFWKKMGVE